MSMGTLRSRQVGPYFHPPVAPALTEQALAAAGLPATPFAALTMQLVRTSPKGKWHVPGQGGQRCPHLNRSFGYGPTELPLQAVSVLGDYEFCSSCAHAVGLPGPAGVLYTAAGVVVAAAAWVTELEQLAPRMDWLDVARWSCQTPFGPPDPMPGLLGQLSGARGFARHRLTTQGAWSILRERSIAALAAARQAAGPPGLRALAARARSLVSADHNTRSEAYAVEAIGGGARRASYQPDLWSDAVDAWLAALAADGDTRAGHAAMLAVVESRYGQAAVRDVSLLPDPALTPAAGHATPADWAAAEYAAVRQRLVDQWCSRLDRALRDAQDRTHDGTRLLLVTGWPIISSADRELAYVTQYPLLDRAVVATANDYAPPPQHLPWAVVLAVPTFAAEHTAAHRSSTLRAQVGAPIDPDTEPDPHEIRALLRRAAGYLPADAAHDPAADLPAVTGWRAETGYPTDLRTWASTAGYGHDLPSRWRWVPDTDPSADGPGSLAVLTRLCAALHQQRQPVRMRVAAGEPDALSPAELLVYPREVDPDHPALVYVAHDLPGCPPVQVPLRRLVSLSDAR